MDEIFDSTLTRSTAVGILMVCPLEDRAPLMDWIADRNREKARQQRNQHNGDTVDLALSLLLGILLPCMLQIDLGLHCICNIACMSRAKALCLYQCCSTIVVQVPPK